MAWEIEMISSFEKYIYIYILIFYLSVQVCMQHLLNITKSLEKIERLLRGEVDRLGEPSVDGTDR